MTGRPIDTADLRERAQLRKAAACALCNGDVLALCDALDAARAALADIAYNTSLSIPLAMGGGEAVEASFYRGQTCRAIGVAARALGEEKQR